MTNVGFWNFVNAARVLAVTGVKSAPLKQAIDQARERGLLIDATMGKRTRAAVWLDTGHVVLSQTMPETLAARINGQP